MEVHILPRGRWNGIRESQSFGIAYEIPHSSASQAECDAVTEVLAQTIRSRDTGLLAPAAIPLRPLVDATVLSWWLEMFRGTRGLLLGTSLVLLGLSVLVRSRALAFGAVGLGAAELLARASGFSFGDSHLDPVWLLPASLLLLVFARPRHSVASGEDRALLFAVFGLGWALRLALGPWGPLRINGQGPAWVAGAAGDADAVAAYGHGYVEIFTPIAALAPSSPDWAIFAYNTFISALGPALAFALARLAGISSRVALLGALLLAIDPVAIRMAATESYIPPIILLCTLAGVALLLGARQMALGGGWRAAACIAAAGLLLAQAARIHPAAWGPVATVPFVVLAGDARNVARRLLLFVAAAAIVGGLIVATSGGALLDVLSNVRAGTLMRPPPPPLRPLAYVAVATAVCAVLAPQRWLAIPAGVAAAGLLTTRYVYGQSWIWQQCYDRLYLTLPLVVGLSCLPAALFVRRWIALPIGVVVALAWFRFGLPIIAARTTDHLEYRWLREQLAHLPAECRIIHVASADKRVLLLPTYVGARSTAAMAMNPREPHTITAALSPTACLYYVHTSLCSSAEGRPACDAIEKRLRLTPVAEAWFPARPSNEGLPYDSDPVEAIIERVDSAS